MNQIVQVFNTIYKPVFDENKDEYIDKSPYKRYERNCIHYECRCKAGASFTSNASFKQHIKSKTHKDFINNYRKYYKEIDESSEKIKKLISENELLIRKNNKLTKRVEDLLNIIKDINDDEQFDDCM